MTPDASSKKEKLFVLVVVSFGLLCVLQAVNISLHLAFYSSCAKTADFEPIIKNLTEEGEDLKRKLSTCVNNSQLGWVSFNHSSLLAKTQTRRGSTQFTDQTPLNSPNIKATRRMQQIEMADYVNERPRREQKRRRDTTQTERRLCHLLFLGFGVLFIIQAILNISLRLTLYNALTRDKNLLENRNTELTNMIKNVEEERDRLKTKLRELSGCSSSQPCPAGWRLINCRCYFVSTEEKTWMDSREYCLSKDADLVVIYREEEQTNLYRLNGNGLVYWIGLYVPTGSTGWKWVDGSALTKSFWTPDQPSRHPVIIEDCVTMCFSYPELANWHDYPCSSKQRWLCEKAPRPCL